jgi:hypothetical protein
MGIYGRSTEDYGIDSSSVPAPGCVFCNQYQDESGQEYCKLCDWQKVQGGQFVPYSYKDENNKADTLGACKYAENIKYIKRNKASITWSNIPFCTASHVYMSEAQKRSMTVWSACIYKKIGIIYTRGHPDFKIYEINGLYPFGAISIQAFDKHSCSVDNVDYFILQSQANGFCSPPHYRIVDIQYFAYAGTSAGDIRSELYLLTNPLAGINQGFANILLNPSTAFSSGNSNIFYNIFRI